MSSLIQGFSSSVFLSSMSFAVSIIAEVSCSDKRLISRQIIMSEGMVEITFFYISKKLV